MPKSAFSAFERRRSTILAEKRRKSQTFPGQSNSHQFQYDNPGFKHDENI